MSMLPLESTPVVTTFIPAMTADAGLVPWADVGMMQIFLLPSPLDLWKPLMAISPAYSPAAPELGCRETESKPVMTANCCARSYTSHPHTSKGLFQTVTEEEKCIAFGLRSRMQHVQIGNSKGTTAKDAQQCSVE